MTGWCKWVFTTIEYVDHANIVCYTRSMMTYLVYALRYPLSREIFYVGSTNSIKDRLWSHSSALGLKPHVDILEYYCLDRNQAFKAEQWWIKEML